MFAYNGIFDVVSISVHTRDIGFGYSWKMHNRVEAREQKYSTSLSRSNDQAGGAPH